MKFLGLDLGWQSGPSGVCCLEMVEGTLTLTQLSRKDTLEEVLDWIDAIAPVVTEVYSSPASPASPAYASSAPAIIAVDAPLLIPNQTGMRLPDRLAHKYFGKYHAGCYPANLNRPFAARLVQFGLSLEQRGFEHAPTIAPQTSGRYQVEVFPHPATIQLFNLSQILKYKKGRLAQRAEALAQLRDYILTVLPKHDPPLIIKQLPAIPSNGKALKAVEDQLDSVICAYVAAHWWYWGEARNGVLGDRTSGYIIVPSPPQAPVSLT